MGKSTRVSYIEKYGIGRNKFIDFAYSYLELNHHRKLKENHFIRHGLQPHWGTLINTKIEMSSGNIKIIQNAYNDAQYLAFELIDRNISREEFKYRYEVYKKFLTKRQHNKIKKILQEGTQ